MRQIKFRGQKSSTKEWVYGSLISDKNGGYAIVQQTENPISNGEVRGWCFGVISETVGQYTGLKDKNGNDIYEGDILKFSNNNTAPVIFNNGCFECFDEPLGYSVDDFDYESKMFDKFETEKYCEIIGNIHTNPELIQSIK